MSASAGLLSQSLVGLLPAGIVPVQVTVRVTPAAVGTFTVWEPGSAAKAGGAGNANNPTTAAVAMARERRMRAPQTVWLPPGEVHARPGGQAGPLERSAGVVRPAEQAICPAVVEQRTPFRLGSEVEDAGHRERVVAPLVLGPELGVDPRDDVVE